MPVDLSSRQRQRQASFQRFAAEHVAPVADQFDLDQAISGDVVAALRRQKLFGTQVPSDFGGRSFDAVSYGLLHEEVGKVCSSTRSLLTVHDMVCEVVWRLGSRQLRAEVLSELTSGRRIAAFALSEPGAGSDAAGVETVARRDGDTFVIDGTKTWISFAQLADLFLVIARIDEEGTIGGILVPRDAPGLSVEPISNMLGLRASMLGEVRLQECQVPASSLVGSARLASGMVVGVALQLGRYSVAWGCVGIGQACADASFRYSAARTQFGSAIAEHQLVRRMLSDMRTDVRAARLLCLEAGRLLDARSPEAVEATFVAKYFASRMANRVAADAVQVHGASGASDRHAVARHSRDAQVMEIIEGSTQIQQVQIASYGLKELRGDVS